MADEIAVSPEAPAEEAIRALAKAHGVVHTRSKLDDWDDSKSVCCRKVEALSGRLNAVLPSKNDN